MKIYIFKDNEKINKDMDRGSRYDQMGLYMKVIEKMIRPVG